MYTPIEECRLCGSRALEKVLDLGMQSLTGVFPKRRDEEVPAGPLQLVACGDCHLLQLGHNYDLGKLYGDTYGYRSGLNQSMVRHLRGKVARILERVKLQTGDLVIDIGANDSTLLQAYPPDGLTLVGVDPSGPKFQKFYPDHVSLIPDFYSYANIARALPGRRAKIVTSIAMFYDLEQPMRFVDDIVRVLDDEGVWVFEQSYLPLMLETNSYDTVCHEHLEYYAIAQIKWMTDRAGLKIVDVQCNDINGGSFSVMAAKRESGYPEATAVVDDMLRAEAALGLQGLDVYRDFERRVSLHRREFSELLDALNRRGQKVLGYGASTKGNVTIQYCGITERQIPFIAEVNEDKFGAFTPGSKIPIISEAEARAMEPDCLVVFPWHFRQGIVEREQAFLEGGGKLIFPLPKIEIVTRDGVLTPQGAVEATTARREQI
jgi:hypothetical protein